jgi:hypothetical protein
MVNYYTWHHGAFFVVSKPRPKPNNQGWFPNETTVRIINYSIDPLAIALFNDPFS